MELNYKSFGSGPPVIILHGLFGMLDNWQTFGKRLAEGYEVFIVDQRNHGRSFHSPEFDYSLLASDLRHFISFHNLDNPSIIGHSMGGKAAMQFSLLYPKMIRNQIIVDIGPKTYPPVHEHIFRAITSVNLANMRTRKETDHALSEKIRDLAIRQFLLKNLSRDSEGSFYWKANFSDLFEQYVHITGNINWIENRISHVHSLFIRAEESNYLAEDDLYEIRRMFKMAEMTSVNAGHWIHTEKPLVLLEIIRNFLHYN